MAPTSIALASVRSPIGAILVAADERALLALEFEDFEARLMAGLKARFGAVPTKQARDPLGIATQLRAYLDGDLAALEAISVDPGGSPFQKRVWSALRRVPAGRTWSYGQMARRLGSPTALRAVGNANGRNPISIVIPCHRLIGSDGSLTGYGGGIARKRWLLAHEGALPGASRAARRNQPP
ncbi:MAG: methylated-DNA--[protein]-cysteine S-methyltransferase [Dongiaceae bacterium]